MALIPSPFPSAVLTVTAADGSIVVGGTPSQPTIAVGVIPAWSSLLLAPAGGLAETYPRYLSTGVDTTATGTVYVSAIGLPKGTAVTNITMCTSTASQSGGTHGWFALLDSTGKVLAVSADQTGAAFFTGNTLITLAMGAPYTVPAAGLYYAAQSVTATGMPNWSAISLPSSSATARTPVLGGTAGTQNAPPALNATLTISASTFAPYAYVS